MAKGYVADFCACSEERKILQTTLAKAAQLNCRGGCFAEAAKCMREGVESGLSAENTAAVLVGSMEDVKAECKAKGIDLHEDMFADMLHAEFEDHLAAARLPY